MAGPLVLDGPPAAPPEEPTPPPGSRRAARLAAAAASGPVLMLAFPPYAIWPAAPVAVALLALATRGVRARQGAALGAVAGATFFVPLLHWTGIYVGPVPWLVLALVQTLYFVPMGAAYALAGRLRPLPWALVTACVWVLQEAVRGRWPYGGFPWGRLGFAMADAPLAHLAGVGGVPLVSLGAALVGTLAAAACLAVALRTVAVTAGLAVAMLLAPLALPFAQPGSGPGPDRTLRVAVVQGNVPRAGLDFNAQRSAVLRNHAARTHELAAKVEAGLVERPDVVVWPENSSDIDPFEDPAAFEIIDEAVKAVGVPVLVGAVLDGPGRYVSNTGIVWDPQSGPGERYTKRHPVPFAEYIPMRSVARKFSSAVDRVARDFVHGGEVGALEVAGTVLGDVICFEVGYDGLVRDVVQEGAQVLVVQTNNATFGRTPQTEQQLQMSRLRAQETGRWVLVAATSGVSAIVAPDGTVEQRTALFTPDVLRATVTLADPGSTTLATRVGIAPEVLACAIGLLGLAVARRRRNADRTLSGDR